MAESFLRVKEQGGILQHHAEKLGVATVQLRRWVKDLEKLKEQAKNNTHSKTLYP